MASKKVLAVFGASGLQAGGVISFLLKHTTLSQRYDIRAISRNLGAARSNCIFPKDAVTWTQADLSQPRSVTAALKGADVVFGLTNFWEQCDYDVDLAQGKNIVNACLENSVDWLIWSSQYPAKKTSAGALPFVPAVDGKADVAKYLEEVKHRGGRNGRGLVATQIIPTFYYQNLAKFLVWPNEQGQLLWKMPWHKDAVIPFVDSEVDCGAYVASILLSDPELMDGQIFHVGSEWTTPQKMINEFEQITGQKMEFQQVTIEECAQSLPPSEGMRRWLPLLFQIVGIHSEWGPGSQEVQPEHDKILQKLGKGYKKSVWRDYISRGGFTNEYTARMDALSKMWTQDVPLKAKL